MDTEELKNEISREADIAIKEFLCQSLRVSELKGKAQVLDSLIALYEKRLDKLLEDEDRDQPVLNQIAEIERQFRPHIKYARKLLKMCRNLQLGIEGEKKKNELQKESLEKSKADGIVKLEDAKREHFKDTKHWPELDDEALRLEQELSTMKITHGNLLDRQQIEKVREVSKLRGEVFRSKQQADHYRKQIAELKSQVAFLRERGKTSKGQTETKTSGSITRVPEQDKTKKAVPTSCYPAAVFKSPAPTLEFSLRTIGRQTSPSQSTDLPAVPRPMTSISMAEVKEKQPRKMGEKSKKYDVCPSRVQTPRQRPKKQGTSKMFPLSFKEPLAQQSAGMPVPETAEAAAGSASTLKDADTSKRPRITRTLMSRSYKTMGPQEF